MDLVLLQTFLELEQAGTMSTAAERLHVTQATVSARITQLEELLEQRLFERSKSGSQLTAAGHQFSPYAQRMIGLWGKAQEELSDTRPAPARLRLGGEYTLSTSVLLNWLTGLRGDRTDVHLHTVVDSAERLMDLVQQGKLDIAVLYSPLRRRGVRSNLVLQEELICVSTEPGRRRVHSETYVYVDWGPDFAAQHRHALPELDDVATHIGLGPLALRYLVRVGGAGYFRTRAVAPFLKQKKLFRVRDMPSFSYSIYAAYSAHSDGELTTWALECLEQSSANGVEGWI
jgi:DNA-binding transcriptional LysR family regulator